MRAEQHRWRWWVAAAMAATALYGCDEDDPAPNVQLDAGPESDAGGGDAGTGASDAGPAAATRFLLRIENISGEGPLPSPISPGVALASATANPIFAVNQADRGQGLAALAEDGAAAGLGAALTGSVVFDTPVGATAAGPAMAGGAYEVEVSARPGEQLTFATMFVQSNDLFLAPADRIALFDAGGAALAERDVTSMVDLWDVGSEANEAPGAGPNQAPRQSGANVGPSEGMVRAFVASTHALPLASALVDVTVSETGGTYTITLDNTSGAVGTLPTPISPLLWAAHAATASLFTEGAAASSGLEALAEDGDPAGWVTALTGQTGIGTVGSQGAAPAAPGAQLSFQVTPTAAAPVLSFATMVVETNDAFIALPPSGVALLTSANAPRPAAEVQAEIRRRLAVWDAGTEADQIPGVGPDQAPRQTGVNTGAADPVGTVRRHADATNALATLGDLVEVDVVNGSASGTFDVTISTIGVDAGFPTLTPVVWALHTSATALFTAGAPASAGLEALAEDGATAALEAALTADAAVGSSGVQAMATGASTAGPIDPGGSYTFSVTPDATHRYLSFATMLVPSNDAFLAFGPAGVALLNAAGNPRSDMDIATDIAATLAAWDAGTEQNQAGAAGSDQAPRGTANTGEAEGNGFLRLMPDGVWRYPAPADIVRVTIRPAP